MPLTFRTAALGLAIIAIISPRLHAMEPDRVELKKALKRAGYYHDNVNAAHPKEVEAAIRRYEQDNGLPMTGQVSPELLQKLGLQKGSAVAATAPAPVFSQTPPSLPMPSTELALFIGTQLGNVLAPLNQNVSTPRQQAVELRERFGDQMNKAPETQKPVYKQAALVMQTVIGAMDEREKALTEARHSKMPDLQDTHDARVSVKGRHGHAAVKSERMENNRNAHAAQQKSEFLEETAVKQWGDRSNVLRQTIDRAYAVERDLEREGAK